MRTIYSAPLLNQPSAVKEGYLQWSKITQPLTGCIKELEIQDNCILSDAEGDNCVSNISAVSAKMLD